MKSEKQFEQIHRPFLFDTDDKDQDGACQDERIEQRWNVELSQHAKENVKSPYYPSPSGPTPRPLLKGNGVRQGRKRQGNPYADVGSGEN